MAESRKIARVQMSTGTVADAALFTLGMILEVRGLVGTPASIA
jgi:hypothetical protein